MVTGLTVVAVSYNAAKYVDAMLASVWASISDVAVEIVVVDNSSSDDTVARVETHTDIRVVQQSNTGYAHGVNRGIEQAAAGNDILVINPDVVLAPEAIARLLLVLADRPDAAIVVPRLVDDRGTTLPSLRREPTAWRTLVEALIGGSRAGRFGEAYAPEVGGGRRDVDWATGAVMLLRREAVTVLGPMDDSFFLYSEETEYCLRARDHGFATVCEPGAIAHHVGGDMAKNPDLWALRAVNRVRLHRRRAGRASSVGFWAASALFELRRALTGERVSRVALRVLVCGDPETQAAALSLKLAGTARHAA